MGARSFPMPLGPGRDPQGTSLEKRSALGEAGGGAQLGPRRGLGFRARKRLWRRRRRGPDLLRQRLALEQQLEFGGVEHFAFEQRLGDALERFAVVLQDAARAVV